MVLTLLGWTLVNGFYSFSWQCDRSFILTVKLINESLRQINRGIGVTDRKNYGIHEVDCRTSPTEDVYKLLIPARPLSAEVVNFSAQRRKLICGSFRERCLRERSSCSRKTGKDWCVTLRKLLPWLTDLFNNQGKHNSLSEIKRRPKMHNRIPLHRGVHAH